MWEEFNTEPYTEEELKLIIDDALCHGFQIKWENGKLYFRETLG